MKRRGTIAGLLLAALALLLGGCGVSESSGTDTAVAEVSPAGLDFNEPSPGTSSSFDDVGAELLKMPLGSNTKSGEAKTWKSEQFTTHGGPLMVEFEVTEYGDYDYTGDSGWSGYCKLTLMEPGGFYDEDTAPSWTPDWMDGIDRYRGQVLDPDGMLVSAGTYIALVEVQNLYGRIRLVEIP